MRQNSEITLYTYALSPFGMKVYWALHYKNLPFELVYVHPRSQREISFTHQKIVPVLKIGEAWKQDSSQTCLWLDETFPDRPISGATEEARQAILEAEQWVNNNIVALNFRAAIDKEEGLTAFRNGVILGKTMRATSGGVPYVTRFLWSRILRQVDFVQHAARRIDPDVSLRDHRKRILEAFELRLQSTGFLAETDTPTMADLGAYAVMATGPIFGIQGGLTSLKSKAVSDWLRRMRAAMPDHLTPPLVPGWRIDQAEF